MKKPGLLSAMGAALLLFFPGAGHGGEKSRLIANLEAGQRQTVVAYGTSLTHWGAWVEQLSAELARRYPGLPTVINSGQAAMCSTWGVENLEERVIARRPDTVLIEFSINDAFAPYNVRLEQARSNLVFMVDRILAANRSCEIVLMVMNPPTGKHLTWRPRLDSYNQLYRDVAAQRGFLLIDHYPNWMRILKSDPRRFAAYVPDDIHPNDEGCRQVITPAILRALGLADNPPDKGASAQPPARP